MHFADFALQVLAASESSSRTQVLASCAPASDSRQGRGSTLAQADAHPPELAFSPVGSKILCRDSPLRCSNRSHDPGRWRVDRQRRGQFKRGCAVLEQLVNEWYSGAIRPIYPQSCYKQAVRRLPSGLLVTSSAKRDIRAAGLAARRGESAPAEKPLPTARPSHPAKRFRSSQPGLLPCFASKPGGPCSEVPERTLTGGGATLPLWLWPIAAALVMLLVGLGYWRRPLRFRT